MDFNPFQISIGTAIVRLAPFAMVVLIVLIVSLARYYGRRLKSRERLAAIEKGLLLPEDSMSPRYAAARTRRTAFVLIAVGVGIALAFVVLAWILQQRPVLSVAAFAIIPFVIGIGLLIDYRLQSRALAKAENENIPNLLSASGSLAVTGIPDQSPSPAGDAEGKQ